MPLPLEHGKLTRVKGRPASYLRTIIVLRHVNYLTFKKEEDNIKAFTLGRCRRGVAHISECIIEKKQRLII